jgi:hypothetical protein
MCLKSRDSGVAIPDCAVNGALTRSIGGGKQGITMNKLLLGAVALGGMALAAAPAAAATYMPVGVQSNVALSTVTSGGWTLCYAQAMGVSMGNSVLDELAACNATGKSVMLAGRATGSDTLLLLAQAPYADVIFNTGINTGTVHVANGAEWYYSDNYSWGFAGLGDTVYKGQCDVNAGAQRMCLHTVNDAGGYRIGDITGLNSSTAYEKLIFVADATPAVPEPATWAMMMLGFGAMGGILRRRSAVTARIRFA